jgi:general secretion pathway protein F
MQFEVIALSANQTVNTLSIEALDEQDARHQVEAQGLYIAEIAPKRKLGNTFFSKGQLSLILFSQELLALLNAGLSIVESLDALLEKEANQGTRAILTRLLTGLREGKRFSGVLAEQPELFTPLYIGIIKAAEGTSDLPRSLSRFIDYQQRINAVRSKVISSAIYPLILLCVGTGVAFFLIAYVVPRFAEVYRGAGRNLPWMSQLLLDWGNFAATKPWTVILGAAAIVTTLILSARYFIKTGGIARTAYRIPGLGERIRIYELARLYLTLGMLLEGGIPIITAMVTVQGIVSSEMKRHLQSAMLLIQSGIPLSNAFEDHQLTTSISLRMLRVGERSGELGSMLTQSATFYDGEISRWIDRFTRMFEPILMAIIGIVVGGIVVLLYMPIFDLAGSLS